MKTKEEAFNFFLNILIVIGIVAVLFAIYSLSMTIYDNFTISKECLNKIGEELCSERNLIYSNSYWKDLGGMIFSCKQEERAKDYQTFLFTEEEVEGCRK